MACEAGCCDSQREHYQSLHVASPDRGRARSTTDDHGTHQVTVTEHADGRQDVTVHAPPIGIGLAPQQPGV